MRQEVDRPCTACGSHSVDVQLSLSDDKQVFLKRYDDKYYGGALRIIFSEKDYVLNRCGACGHYQYKSVICEPKLGQMYRAHAEFKLNAKEIILKDEIKKIRNNVLPLLQSFKKIFGGTPALLDYGAGLGTWAIIAKDIGFKVVAYEPYSFRSDSDVDIITKWKDIEGEKVDVIICNQVMEHLQNPNLIFPRLAKVSAPGTLMYCSVPNAGKIADSKLCETWPYDGKKSHVMAPFQHLNGFTQRSLCSLMAKHGFQARLRDNFTWSLKGIFKLIALVTKGKFRIFSTTSVVFRYQGDI